MAKSSYLRMRAWDNHAQECRCPAVATEHSLYAILLYILPIYEQYIYCLLLKTKLGPKFLKRVSCMKSICNFAFAHFST